MLEHFYRPQPARWKTPYIPFAIYIFYSFPWHYTVSTTTVYSPLPLYAIEVENCNNYLVTHHYLTYKSQEAIDKYHKGFSYCHFHQELVVITWNISVVMRKWYNDTMVKWCGD